jgi:uncharacterized protein
MIAAKLCHLEVLQELLAKDADIHGINDEGETALIKAAGKGNLEIAKVLLIHGTDIKARAKDGTTALSGYPGPGTFACRIIPDKK